MANKSLKISLWTPPGRLSYPKLATPIPVGEMDAGKYTTQLVIAKDVFKEKGKILIQAITDVGKARFGNEFSLKSKWYVPIKDADVKEALKNEQVKGCVIVTAKNSKFQPDFIGPRKDSKGKFPALTKEEIARLKGGDWCLLHVDVYSYVEGTGGVSLGLNAVQYWKPGEAFGGDGDRRIFETAEELEAELEAAGASNTAEAEELSF